MKYSFGVRHKSPRKLFTITNIKSFATSTLVAFLILGFPAQSFANTGNRNDNSKNIISEDVVKTDTQPPLNSSLDKESKDTKQISKNENIENKTSKQIAGPENSVMLRTSMPSGASEPFSDDISNINDRGSTAFQSGSYNYSYPITVPEGRNGLTPEVNLNYSSQGENDISPFGYGWNISIPEIERINLTGTNNLYQENYFSSSLDGQLVSVSSSTYRAKVETGSFNTYTFSNNKWLVYDKEGNKFTFGSSTSARQDNASNTSQISNWLLEEVVDKNGEKISYTYFKNNGQIYPNTISYVYENGVPFYVISFIRSTTSVSHSQFKKGYEEKRNYTIANIQVAVNGTKVTNYDLTYGTGSIGHTNILLNSIKVTGYDSDNIATSLPANTFTYKENSPTITYPNNATWASTTPNDLYAKFYAPAGAPSASSTETYYKNKLIDMNGDGLADWVFNGEVYMNTGNGWTATATWTGLETESSKYQLIDINGDGLPDQVKAASYEFDPVLGLSNYKDVEFKFNNGDGTWSINPAWSTTTPLVFFIQTQTTSGTYAVRTYNYFSDMNGDGLADWIFNGNVHMNTGNGWTATATWTGMPANFEYYYRLDDVNNDTLPDIIKAYKRTFASSSPTINDYTVQLNKGDGTWVIDPYLSSTIPGPMYTKNEGSTSTTNTIHNVYLEDVDGDGYSEWFVGTSMYRNLGNGWATSANGFPFSSNLFARDIRLTDVNGDSIPDLVNSWTKTWDSSYGLPDEIIRKVYISDAKKRWMMASTTNEMGGETEINYTPTTFLQNGVLQNPNSPYAIYAVSSISNNPKIGLKSSTTYQYSGGDLYFSASDILSRKFAGFEVVTEITDLGKTKTYYHQGNNSNNTFQEGADDYSKIGVPYREEITNFSNNLFALNLSRFSTLSLGNGSVFLKQDREILMDYDGDGDHRDTAVEYVYENNKGNVLTQTEWGEVTANTDGTFTDIGGDKRTLNYSYASSSSNNILGLIAGENIKNESNITTSDKRFYYDSLSLGEVAKGNLTKVESLATSTYINTQSTYNSYGLKTTDTDPRGFVTSYTYDPYNLFIATTTNALLHNIYITYDYSSGKPKSITDPNNTTKSYVYDGLDRIIEEKIPDPLTGVSVTKTKYVYSDILASTSIKTSNYLSSTTIQDSYSFLDGYGREIQSRVSNEVNSQFIVEDTIFGLNDLIQKSSLPYFAFGNTRSTATTSSNLYTTYSYDALGRVSSTTNVTGTSFITYDQWKTTEKNVLGNEKDLSNDAYDRLIQVVEHNGTSTYLTQYQWDSNGSLIKITDALGNIRNFTYDNLSRRLSMEDLHKPTDSTFGKWYFTYDAAGNIISKTDPKNQVILFTYDNLSRPLTENYTGTAGIEVAYVYDSCTRGIGQACTVANNSATTSYSYAYNLLPATESKIIGTSSFATNYIYDWSDNSTLVTYPDSSEVRNTYNKGNQLERVEQKESGGSWRDIISNFDYHPTGQISYEVNGNGTKTTKVYDSSELYRLRSITTTASSTNGTGGGGTELEEIENNLSYPLSEELARQEINEEIEETPEKIDLLDTRSDIIPKVISEQFTATTSASSTEILNSTSSENLASTSIDIIFGVPTTTESVSIPIADTIAETTKATSSETEKEIIVTPLIEVDTKSTDKLITNIHEARAWQKFHSERRAGLEQLKGVSSTTLEAAQYAKNKFDGYLIEKEYMESPDGPIRVNIKDKVYNKLKNVKDSVFDIMSYLLPEKAYAYIFGAEDFESCSSIPCSFSSNTSWGSVTSSIDTTNRVNGVKSLKSVVTGEGNGALENSGYDTGEIWAQFKVYIPTTMTWGASGYYSLLRFEDTSNNVVFWMSLENWGTARLTIAGDTLGWTNTGLDLPKGATSTVEVRFKKGSTNGDVDIWLNNSNQASPSYNGSGVLNTGTDNVDDIQFGVTYAPENGIATTYYDDAVVNSSFIGTITNGPALPFAAYVQRLNYSYDALGNIIQIADTSNTNAAATTTYAYDDLSRMISATAVGGSAPYSETYSYNAIGNIVSKSDVGTYSYSGDSTSETTYPIYSDSIASGWSSYSWNVTLNPSNTSPVYSGSNSLRAAYTTAWGGVSYHTNSINSTLYNKLRLNVYVGTSTSVQLYGYFNNASGTPLSVVSLGSYASGGWQTNTWQQLEIPFSALNFTNYSGATEFNIESSLAVPIIYDQIELVGSASSQNYANPHAPTSIAGITQNYDQNGNLASSSAFTNTWSYDNRLTSTARSSSTANYYYDSLGKRVKKSVGSNVTLYPSNLYEVTGTSTTKHIYANDSLVATLESNTPASKVYYNHGDHLDSTGVVTDKDGYLDQVMGYKPYGSKRLNEQFGSLNQSNQYVGQDYDPESDLNYMNARYYDSLKAQFISQDPVFWEIGETEEGIAALNNPQLQNSYSYAAGNPVINKDPDGRFLDTILDLGFIAYDSYKVVDTYFRGGNVRQELKYLGLDLAGAVTPFATGFGVAARTVKIAETAAKSTNGASNVSKAVNTVSKTVTTVAKATPSATPKVHGNSLKSTKPTVGYTLRDKKTNEVLKYGITSNPKPTNRYTRAYYKKHNVKMRVEKEGSRKKMHNWESKKIKKHKEKHGKRPKHNKNNH